jgi:hypothetical protein
MSVKRCNPAHMSEAERLAELGALLARAYRRLVAQNQQMGLADIPETERPCDRAVVSRAQNSKDAT